MTNENQCDEKLNHIIYAWKVTHAFDHVYISTRNPKHKPNKEIPRIAQEIGWKPDDVARRATSLIEQRKREANEKARLKRRDAREKRLQKEHGEDQDYLEWKQTVGDPDATYLDYRELTKDVYDMNAERDFIDAYDMDMSAFNSMRGYCRKFKLGGFTKLDYFNMTAPKEFDVSEWWDKDKYGKDWRETLDGYMRAKENRGGHGLPDDGWGPIDYSTLTRHLKG